MSWDVRVITKRGRGGEVASLAFNVLWEGMEGEKWSICISYTEHPLERREEKELSIDRACFVFAR